MRRSIKEIVQTFQGVGTYKGAARQLGVDRRTVKKWVLKTRQLVPGNPTLTAQSRAFAKVISDFYRFKVIAGVLKLLILLIATSPTSIAT